MATRLPEAGPAGQYVRWRICKCQLVSYSEHRATQSFATAKGYPESGGVLFSSNPRGNNSEGWNNGRYGAYHDLAAWRKFMTEAGFIELDHYYRPTGLPREQQNWLASVWRKL